MAVHASFLPWRLAGTLWPEGSKGLSRFPHWFRHQTGQGWVWILRRVESTQKWRRHEEKWDAQNEEKTKFPTGISPFLWVCCFVFFTPQVGVVSSSVGLHSRDKLEACFEKNRRIQKVHHGQCFQVPGELAGCWWSFPSEAGSRNHDLYWCYRGITYCIGEPWRSTSVGWWVPWLPTCWVLKFEENVTSFCSNFVIKFWVLNLQKCRKLWRP